MDGTRASARSAEAALPRVAVLADMLEEQWPSMDLVADMLVKHLGQHAASARVSLVRPEMRRRASRAPLIRGRRGAYNVDRVVNRFWDYARVVRASRRDFDVFHVIDHSYAQLVHSLPAARTVVTCHDLDAFRCLLEPVAEARSPLFRAMSRRILSGLVRAERVVCVSGATRDELLSHGLVPPERVVVIPNGVHPSCVPEADPQAEAEAERLLGAGGRQNLELLHVGSTVPRKRVDVLLRVFAEVRREYPNARLVRVGGAFSAEQHRLASTLGIVDAIRVLPFLPRDTLAAVYRRAALVLQPSEREGFGLPVVEALACGTPVLASDLAVFREIGGESAAYAPAGDVPAWADAVLHLLSERERNVERWEGRRQRGVEHAKQFSWAQNARRMLEVYREMVC